MRYTYWFLVFTFMLGFCAIGQSEEIRLNGATTTIKGVITPHKDAVEKATGFTLAIVGNATGKGLVDLVEGRCDASLTSEPLEIAVQAAKNAGKEVAMDTFKLSVVKMTEIVFIVHPSNPVNELTWEQLKGMHTGKITNWKDVGGPDMPIAVFTDTVTGGTRAMIKTVVLGGEEYGANCRAQEAVKFVQAQVGEVKGGIGGIGIDFVDPKLVKTVKTQNIERPLGFITLGEPSEKVKKVIDAFTAEASK